MKRLVIVIVMMVGMVSLSCYSLYKTYTVREQVTGIINEILEVNSSGDTEEITRLTIKLDDYWQAEGKSLRHYIRINQVDEISQKIRRLTALAGMDNMAEFNAELISIQWQIDNIWYMELPTFGNIF